MPTTQEVSDIAAGADSVHVTGLRLGRPFAGTDAVAEEVPVALEYNGVSHAVMLATPLQLQEFALGFSLTEGIVDSSAQWYGCELEHTAQGIVAHMEIASSSFARLKDRRRSLVGRTGCGLCGADNLSGAVHTPPRVPQRRIFGVSAVAAGMQSLSAGQYLNGLTGATHAAAWCDADGKPVLTREDVGRHNALDKLVGAMAQQQLAADAGFVVISSRASYEMVHKTAMLGAGLLAAVSGVTALAVRVAEQAQLSLLGFVRPGSLSVYTHPENLDMNA